MSAQTVSRVARSLDGEIARFHQGAVAADVQYLFLDGVYLKVRSAVDIPVKGVDLVRRCRGPDLLILLISFQAWSTSTARYLADSAG